MSEEETTEHDEQPKPRFIHGRNNKAVRPFLVWGKLLTTLGLIGPVVLVLLLIAIPAPLMERFLPWLGIDGLDLLLLLSVCYPFLIAGFLSLAYFLGYSGCQNTHDIFDAIDQANRKRHQMSPPIRIQEQIAGNNDDTQESEKLPFVSVGAFISQEKLRSFAIAAIIVGAGLKLAMKVISSASFAEDFILALTFPSVIADLLLTGGLVALLYVTGYRQCMSINGIDREADAALQRENRAHFEKQRLARAAELKKKATN